MWHLKSETDPRVIYILPTKVVTIGRTGDFQNCDFAITDASISRKHATLSISDDNLVLSDLGSKYGTFVNNSSEKVESNVKITVNNNDTIKFGKLNSIWKVHKIDIVTCASTLKGENLQSLKLCLDQLNAVLKYDWDDSCTYLTMPGITLTIKVVLALVQCSYIVTTEFWNKCIEAVNSNMELPSPQNFIPHVIESTLNKENVSFLQNEKRQTLFRDKKFVFFSRKQLDMYKLVLYKSSASALLLSESKLTKSMLSEDNVIVIQYNITAISQETETQKNQINEIAQYLKSKRKRLVADAEIGLAILYCSFSKYCNPSFQFSNEVIKQTDNSTGKSTVLAQDTEDMTPILQKAENVIIDETKLLMGDQSSTVQNISSVKRKLSDADDNQQNANKKLNTGDSNEIVPTNENLKRKLNEDDDKESNPTKKMAVESDTDSENYFNFSTNSVQNNAKNSEKKLLFAKPVQSKTDFTINEGDEDLFNFIEEQPKTSTENNLQQSIFQNDKNPQIDSKLETSKKVASEKINISELRGIKLPELLQSNLNYKMNYNVTKIKKESVDDDLGEKMNNLDLGFTVITVRNDLIKKEPVDITIDNNKTVNFKKFKKVWPVKKQTSIISRLSMNVSKYPYSEIRDPNPSVVDVDK